MLDVQQKQKKKPLPVFDVRLSAAHALTGHTVHAVSFAFLYGQLYCYKKEKHKNLQEK